MKVLFVCLGNICRSPTAESVFRKKFNDLKIPAYFDSAATSNYHIGDKSDPRSIKHAEKRNYEMTHLGRQISQKDFSDFDHIFVMDTDNYNDVRNLTQNEEFKNKVQFLTEYLYPKRNVAVPDPYYNGRFSEAFELMVTSIEKLLAKLT